MLVNIQIGLYKLITSLKINALISESTHDSTLIKMCYYAAFHGRILYLTDKLYHSTDIASLETRKTLNTLNSV